MDVRTLKRACGVGLLAAAALPNPVAHAANGQVNVDVSLPPLLIMYYYTDISLDLDGAALAGYLSAGGTACGGDFCDGQGDPGTVNVTTIGPTTTVTFPPLNDPYTDADPITIELQEVVGVRALGCTDYTATYDVTGDAGVASATTVSLAGIDTANCSMTLTLGDLSFDLDFDALTAGATDVAATLDVTITGNP